MKIQKRRAKKKKKKRKERKKKTSVFLSDNFCMASHFDSLVEAHCS